MPLSPLLIRLAGRAGVCLAALAMLVLPGESPHLRVHVLAHHVAVGQTFTIEVSSDAPLPRGASLEVGLQREGGARLWQKPLPPATADDWTVSGVLPAAGRYQVTARVNGGRREAATYALQGVVPPPPYFGGVLVVGEFGFPDAVSDALRAHGFALQEGLTQGVPRLIAVADPQLGNHDPGRQYRQIWSAVAAGSNLVLLNPPAADVASYWPFRVRLVDYHDGCGSVWDEGEPALTDGLPPSAADVLRPNLAYDLSSEGAITLLNLRQGLLVRGNGGSGYPGCHAWFRFRYGQGLVTVSSVPVLERSFDAYMRRYLMNLLKVAAQPPHGAPTPGLAAAFARQISGR